MRSWLQRQWQRQQFSPGPFGILLNPFYLARRALWRAMADLAPSLNGRLLDVGCGTMPYRILFSVDEYVGLEIDTPEARSRGVADVFYGGGAFPFEDASFDSLLCNQVLEHVFEPDGFLGEAKRVLVPGGRMVLTVPFVWDEHEQPHDFARYSTFGLKALLVRNGFEILEQRRLLADASVLFQMAAAYMYKVANPRRRLSATVLTAALIAPLTIAGLVARRLLPSNPDLFLDQAVLARRL